MRHRPGYEIWVKESDARVRIHKIIIRIYFFQSVYLNFEIFGAQARVPVLARIVGDNYAVPCLPCFACGRRCGLSFRTDRSAMPVAPATPRLPQSVTLLGCSVARSRSGPRPWRLPRRTAVPCRAARPHPAEKAYCCPSNRSAAVRAAQPRWWLRSAAVCSTISASSPSPATDNGFAKGDAAAFSCPP